MQKQLLVIGLALASLPCLAQAKDEFYLRVGAGQAEASEPGFGDDRAWSLGFGWRFNRFLSAEFGYNDFGRYAGSAPGAGGPLDAETTGLELGLGFKLPFGKTGLFAQARAGAHRWETTRLNTTVSSAHTGTDAYYGLGLGYDFNELVGVQVMVERLGTGIGDVDRVMFAVEVR